MRLSLRPDRVFQQYTQVTAPLLQSRGVKLLLCDLDYTLAPKGQTLPDELVLEWVEALHAVGIQVVILSNNRSTERVHRFCKELGIPYIGHAGKPRPGSFHRVMEEKGVSTSQTAMLGDKLLTDMLGANLSGIWALMVEPKGGAVGIWNHILHILQRPWKAWRREKE